MNVIFSRKVAIMATYFLIYKGGFHMNNFFSFSNSMDFEYVPDWYRAEHYEYSEPLKFMRRSSLEISLFQKFSNIFS